MSLFSKVLVCHGGNAEYAYHIPLLFMVVFLIAAIIQGLRAKNGVLVEAMFLILILSAGTLQVMREIKIEDYVQQSERVVRDYKPITYKDLPISLALVEERKDTLRWKPNTPHDLPISLELQLQ